MVTTGLTVFSWCFIVAVVCICIECLIDEIYEHNDRTRCPEIGIGPPRFFGIIGVLCLMIDAAIGFVFCLTWFINFIVGHL